MPKAYLYISFCSKQTRSSETELVFPKEYIFLMDSNPVSLNSLMLLSKVSKYPLVFGLFVKKLWDDFSNL